MRASVLQVSRRLHAAAGAGRLALAHHHRPILPNSVASVTVVSTINLGVLISLEASLSFLGVGLQPPVISWGNMISDASGLGLIRAAPHMLLFPSLFLSLTVLSFIMLVTLFGTPSIRDFAEEAGMSVTVGRPPTSNARSICCREKAAKS